MKRSFIIFLIFTCHLSLAQTVSISEIYTDFGGFWHGTNYTGNLNTAPNPVNNSHNLLAFKWDRDGKIYSTGVNDAALASNSVVIDDDNKLEFQAFPVFNLPNPGSSTYIGVGSNYGGALNTSLPTGAMAPYLTDGTRGLDLGTGIYNLPSGNTSHYQVVSINPLAIGDGIPDIIITQIGDWPPGSPRDEFYFSGSSFNQIKDNVEVSFANVPNVGVGSFKFYNPGNPNVVLSSPTGNRHIRVVAYDFADFGIDASDVASIQYFSHKLSVVSDQAFIAYNTKAILIYQKIEGTVLQNTCIPGNPGSGFAGAAVNLLDASNNVISSTTTNSAGFYEFPNLPPGDYTVQLPTPSGYIIHSTADGGTDENQSVTLSNSVVSDVNYELCKYQKIQGSVKQNTCAPGNTITAYEGAIVELLQGGAVIATTTTDASGLYEFDNLLPNTYTVRLVTPGGYIIYTTSDGDTNTDQTFTVGISDITGVDYELCNLATPVTWKSFTLERQQETGILLHWETAEEIGNEGFEIEHSTDAKHWNTIGYVKSNLIDGNSKSTQNYTYLHSQAGVGQVHYYRIKQVDFDGKFDYSVIRSIRLNAMHFSVYPNPFTNEFSLLVKEGGSKILKIKITDFAGRSYLEDTKIKTNYAFTNYPKGLYYLTVYYDDNTLETVKLIKE